MTVASTRCPSADGCSSHPPDGSLMSRPAAHESPLFLAAALRKAAKPSASRAWYRAAGPASAALSASVWVTDGPAP